MLLELRVENYAVIDSAAVEFAPGLNLLTGETGAGKSILIDALALLLGERGSSDVIRHGAEKAVVSAVFETSPSIAQVLELNGIDAEDAGLILRREIVSSGKTRVFINNQPATVTVLKQLAPQLATVHAQNESLMSFNAAERLRLLDRFGGFQTQDLSSAHQDYSKMSDRIADLERDEQDRLRLVDVWSFQKGEIEAAKIELGEDARLQTEKSILANAEKLRSAAIAAHEALYDSNVSAAVNLRAAVKYVQELAGYDQKFSEPLTQLESARIAVEDVGPWLRDYAESINASPERLAEIEDRLALLDRLKRKYGSSLDEIVAFGADVAHKLNEVQNRDETVRQLRKEQAAAAANYIELARAVSRKRSETARELEKLVETGINELAMKARFKIDIASSETREAWSANGFDQVECLISTNPGEPLLPMEKIASGGELSRVMLALKATIESSRSFRGQKNTAIKSELRTLVFDEIDTGIGGRAAEAVGQKLKSLSRSHQILCITHLPQIAALADHHYVIEKREKKDANGGRVKTTIRRLTQPERTTEIARMLSGAVLTDTSLKHAEQMLKAKA